MNLSNELKRRIDSHVETVRKHLSSLSADEQREILQSVEAHIYEALESRSNGDPSMKLLDAIIAEMDTPESYGDVAKGRSQHKWLVAILGAILVASTIAGIKFWPPTAPSLLGRWVSVDFVKSIDQFSPGTQSWQGDLYLKEITFLPDGKTDKPYWTWNNGILHHAGDLTDAKLVTKNIQGEEYLFMEWISGDVTIMGLPPKYYVLKKENLKAVRFAQGLETLKPGDTLNLKEVASSSPDFKVGDTVEVKGEYTLSSHPSATLLLSVTGTNRGGRKTPTATEQRLSVKQGSGEFDLTIRIDYEGLLHLTFYDPSEGGPIGGVYFGTKEQVDEAEQLMGQAELKMRGENTQYAWQQTAPYVAPDFEAYFPDDVEGGTKLDALWESPDKDTRTDEEILTTIRNGLRNTTEHKTLILRWIGSKYIWNKSPQNPDAIEIMYHAVDYRGESADVIGGTRHYAVYYGLSVVKSKTPSILKALVDLCMKDDDPNTLGRVAWGAKPQQTELLQYLKPYLESEEEATRLKAESLEQIFTGRLNAFQWAKQKQAEEK